jgi:hypothetical protein
MSLKKILNLAFLLLRYFSDGVFRVLHERSHVYGSTMKRGGWGAMREDKGARDEEREEGEELRRKKAAWARTTWGLRRKEQEWRRMLR